jgi:uncharacterized protein (DUF2141 family)
MKTISKLTLGLLSFATLLALSQCKQPATQPEAGVITSPDTSSTVMDSKDSVKAVVSKDTSSIATQVPLTLTFSNLATPTGPIIVGVYGIKNKFPDPSDQLKLYKFTPDSVSFNAQIADLPFGEYALAIYQDVNNNGKIDKNVLGIPTEPYAFSNNFKPTVKAPGFKNCRFEYTATSNTIAMKMIR